MMPWSPAPSSLFPSASTPLAISIDWACSRIWTSAFASGSRPVRNRCLDGVTGDVLEQIEGDRRRAADLAGDDHLVGGCQRLAGDARFGVGGEVGVDDRVGNAIADLVGMTLGNGFAGKEIVGESHGQHLLDEIRARNLP